MLIYRTCTINQSINHNQSITLDAHEGYAVPAVRGAFWKELAAVGGDGNGQQRPVKLPPGTRALVVHGALNELHHPSNTGPFLEANKGQIANGGEALLLAGAKHNDFMHFGSPAFDEVLSHIATFATATAAAGAGGPGGSGHAAQGGKGL